MAKRGRTKGSKERAIERRFKSLRYRLKGYSFNRIGELLSISNAQAFRDVQEALRIEIENGRGDTEELRELESQRLDDLWKKLHVRLLDSKGVLDLEVVDRLCRLLDRRAKLHGIDKPVTQKVAIDWMEEAKLFGKDEEETRDFVNSLADEIVARSAGANAEGSRGAGGGKDKAASKNRSDGATGA